VPQIKTPPEYTNQNPVEIKGVTEPGVTVFVTANDQKEEIVATKEGLFSYSFNLKRVKISFLSPPKIAPATKARKLKFILLITITSRRKSALNRRPTAVLFMVQNNNKSPLTVKSKTPKH